MSSVLKHSITAQKVAQLPSTFFKVTFWRIKLQNGRQTWPEKNGRFVQHYIKGVQMRKWLPRHRDFGNTYAQHLKASYPNNQGVTHEY